MGRGENTEKEGNGDRADEASPCRNITPDGRGKALAMPHSGLLFYI